jgi:hypothetical protein
MKDIKEAAWNGVNASIYNLFNTKLTNRHVIDASVATEA